jgi:hypothetical protein
MDLVPPLEKEGIPFQKHMLFYILKISPMCYE